MTDFQSALDEGEAALEELDGQKVQLSIAPGVNVAANVGEFRRKRAIEGTGYQWVEFGRIVVRRAALKAAGITVLPDSGQFVTANGTKYRVEYISPDSTSFTLDCINLY